jgi:hypothetical protein
MADDKKPKIDLKARLGKTAVPAPTPAPAPVAVSPSGRPAPRPLSIPAPARSQPPPGALPIPTPSPFAAGGMDRSNPLAAAMAPAYAQPQRQAARPPEPQRIEFDDLTVQQASRGGLKKGIVIGIVLALIFGGVGYTAGGAMEQRAGRDSSKAGAVDMANDATKARDQLKTLADKMEAGRKELLTDHKFPATLAHDLGAINVAFEGTELAGRRFSGFSTDTTRDLIAFVQSVDGINKHRGAIANLLTTLQKPITEQLAIPPGQIKINYVVAVERDPAGNVAGFLSKLVDPIAVIGQNITLPAEYTFIGPGGGGNSKAPSFRSGDIGIKAAAIYVVPKTFDTVCPTAQSSQVAQLGLKIGDFISELKGEAAGDTNTVTDSKPGLIEQADKLIKELGNVGS